MKSRRVGKAAHTLTQSTLHSPLTLAHSRPLLALSKRAEFALIMLQSLLCALIFCQPIVSASSPDDARTDRRARCLLRDSRRTGGQSDARLYRSSRGAFEAKLLPSLSPPLLGRTKKAPYKSEPFCVPQNEMHSKQRILGGCAQISFEQRLLGPAKCGTARTVFGMDSAKVGLDIETEQESSISGSVIR